MIDQLKTILLAMWLGAALLFGAIVAPAVFTVLHSFDLANANEIAGSIVTRTLEVVNVSGFVIGVVCFVTALFLQSTGKGLRRIETLALAIFVVATGVGQWFIAARMRGLRAAMGIIDSIPLTDPRRLEFSRLHQYSVMTLGIALIMVVIALITVSIRIRTINTGGSHR